MGPRPLRARLVRPRSLGLGNACDAASWWGGRQDVLGIAGALLWGPPARPAGEGGVPLLGEGQHVARGPRPSSGLDPGHCRPLLRECSPALSRCWGGPSGCGSNCGPQETDPTPLPGLGQGLTPEPRGRPALGTGGSPQILVDTPSEQRVSAMPAPCPAVHAGVWGQGGRKRRKYLW